MESRDYMDSLTRVFFHTLRVLSQKSTSRWELQDPKMEVPIPYFWPIFEA
jgi:hypothetical protein